VYPYQAKIGSGSKARVSPMMAIENILLGLMMMNV
jgi:hypothetical protein